MGRVETSVCTDHRHWVKKVATGSQEHFARYGWCENKKRTVAGGGGCANSNDERIAFVHVVQQLLLLSINTW